MKVLNAWVKRIFLIIGVGFMLILVMDLNNRMVHMIQLRGEMEAELEKNIELSMTLEDLESEISYAKSDDYAVEWARQQNLMMLDGDTVVVLISDGSYEVSEVKEIEVVEPELDNWEAWKLWLTFHE